MIWDSNQLRAKAWASAPRALRERPRKLGPGLRRGDAVRELGLKQVLFGMRRKLGPVLQRGDSLRWERAAVVVVMVLSCAKSEGGRAGSQPGATLVVVRWDDGQI
jgi:hypothetical protein